MKYYIVDDNLSIIKILERIIETKELGTVVGTSTESDKAILEILSINPDIVLADLLMAKIDGISLVKTLKDHSPEISCVMISQVSDKEMVGNAYKAGVDFFISKPVNIIEVQSVLKQVMEKKHMESTFRNIQGLMSNAQSGAALPGTPAERGVIADIKTFLSIIGILGENATSEIISLCQFLIENNTTYSKAALKGFCAVMNKDSEKNVEQRIRRTIKNGLNNVAHSFLNDYGSDVIREYSGYVFEFKNIRYEMDFIKGKREYGGRVNVTKFFDGLLTYSELASKI